MPAIELLPPRQAQQDTTTSPLPQIFQTPSGLAILEIQGTIQGPFQNLTPDSTSEPTVHQIGRLEFPLYDPRSKDDDGMWMKKVYLYVGKFQRLTGEVKKLAKPLAVLRKVESNEGGSVDLKEVTANEALEIMEVVRFKVLFSGRPEPVGD